MLVYCICMGVSILYMSDRKRVLSANSCTQEIQYICSICFFPIVADDLLSTLEAFFLATLFESSVWLVDNSPTTA